MRQKAGIVIKPSRLIASSITALVLLSITHWNVCAQDGKAITKENLLRSLSTRGQPEKRTAAWYIKMIERQGVDFHVFSDEEDEIRQAGSYLGTKGIADLISAIRSNYRGHLRVSLFKYVPCDQYYDQFKWMLISKFKQIPNILIDEDTRYRYTAGLKLVEEAEAPANMSLEETNQYWKKTRSLQLLQGMCSTRGNDIYVISQVFLGDFQDPLTSPIRIEFKIAPEEYGMTRDLHSLLVLYSIARDAQARGMSKDLIITCLSKASEIAAQIEHSNPETLQAIRSAIDGKLRELAGPPGLLK